MQKISVVFLHIVVFIGYFMKHCVMLRREFSIIELGERVIYIYSCNVATSNSKCYNSLFFDVAMEHLMGNFPSEIQALVALLLKSNSAVICLRYIWPNQLPKQQSHRLNTTAASVRGKRGAWLHKAFILAGLRVSDGSLHLLHPF